jgi:hypothetical protein
MENPTDPTLFSTSSPMSRRICSGCGGQKHFNATACVRCRPRVKPLAGRKGPDHPAWKGGRTVDRDGYIRLYLPDHPWPRKGGYVLAHVAAMELHIGRRILPREVVHHRDHDRQNNALDNLELMDCAEHMRQHHANDGPRNTRTALGRFA